LPSGHESKGGKGEKKKRGEFNPSPKRKGKSLAEKGKLSALALRISGGERKRKNRDGGANDRGGEKKKKKKKKKKGFKREKNGLGILHGDSRGGTGRTTDGMKGGKRKKGKKLKTKSSFSSERNGGEDRKKKRKACRNAVKGKKERKTPILSKKKRKP